MTPFDSLTSVALVMATISMALASFALLPHVKAGLTMLRDVVFWLTLFAIVGIAAAAITWHHLRGREVQATSNPAPDYNASTAKSVAEE